MFKKLSAIAIIGVFTFGLTGCGGGDDKSTPPETQNKKGDTPLVLIENLDNWGGKTGVFTKQLPDGGSVLCVWSENGYSGGISCDWDHKTPSNK
jgi:hypothetical protein